MPQQRDKIYADALGEPSPFVFDDTVARVFPDMIKRSVPGYSTIINMTGLLAGRFAMPGARCYDLGCSLGASTLAMRQNIHCDGCDIVAVDNSLSMLERCRSMIEIDTHDTAVQLVCADVRDVEIENAAVVVLNFTLMFIPPAERQAFVNRIAKGIRPGGILILSEKVTFEDPHLNELNIELHHDFKRANGYSDLEVSQKRSALENVLVPETLASHRQRIGEAGFDHCDVWFQCFNFASMVALRAAETA
jgi:tRNA (cmo5U34)-methyltransferase